MLSFTSGGIIPEVEINCHYLFRGKNLLNYQGGIMLDELLKKIDVILSGLSSDYDMMSDVVVLKKNPIVEEEKYCVTDILKIKEVEKELDKNMAKLEGYYYQALNVINAFKNEEYKKTNNSKVDLLRLHAIKSCISFANAIKKHVKELKNDYVQEGVDAFQPVTTGVLTGCMTFFSRCLKKKRVDTIAFLTKKTDDLDSLVKEIALGKIEKFTISAKNYFRKK